MIRRAVKVVVVTMFLSTMFSTTQADKLAPTPEKILRAYGIEPEIKSLIEALSSKEPAARENAAIVLGSKHDPSVIPYLQKQLDDPYVYARLAAARALVQLGDPIGLARLTQASKDQDEPTVLYAAQALLQSGRREGFKQVTRIARESVSPSNRLRAIKSLAQFLGFKEDKEIVTILAGALRSDTDVRVRRGAAMELQSFKELDAREVFQLELKNEDQTIRGIAEDYIRRSGNRH